MTHPKKPAQSHKASLVAVWLPKEMKLTLDRAITDFDSDRSKYIRAALREKLSRDLSPAA